MHHPACWVKNNGCATGTPHASTPIALAYSGQRLEGGETPHPGEGTRVITRSTAESERSAAPAPPRPPAPAAPLYEDEEEPVIGAAQPSALRVVPGPGASPETGKKRAAARAYAVDRANKPLPRVYGGHRLLRYWYVPAAAALAVIVALGVIWLVDSFAGGDDDDPAAGGDTDATPTASAPPATTTTGTPASTTSPVPTGRFQVDDVVLITGIGTGTDGEPACLNIRTEPGTENTIIDCLREGTQLTVLGGPEEAGGLTWWRVKLPSGDGWAAEDYLAEQ